MKNDTDAQSLFNVWELTKEAWERGKPCVVELPPDEALEARQIGVTPENDAYVVLIEDPDIEGYFIGLVEPEHVTFEIEVPKDEDREPDAPHARSLGYRDDPYGSDGEESGR